MVAASLQLARTSRVRWSIGIRQTHRWVSIAFTLTVIANFIAIALGTSSPWITYSPLLPLGLLLCTGLYLFALPYAEKRRGQSRA